MILLKEFFNLLVSIIFKRIINIQIGFKNFIPYFEKSENCNINNIEKSEILEKCIISFKNHTKKYAKSQKKWLKRFLSKTDIYQLNSNDIYS